MQLHSNFRITTPHFTRIALTLIIASTSLQAKVIDEEPPLNACTTVATAPESCGEDWLPGPADFSDTKTVSPETKITNPVILRPQLLSKASMLKSHDFHSAYKNAFEILAADNACSRFFGGQSAAHVLNELAQRVQIVSLNKENASRMEGQVTFVRNQTFEVSYRLFEKTGLNRNGPFFQAHIFPNDPQVPYVGRFRPRSREAQVTILLHEVGHMVRSADNTWLLPDDGGNADLSMKNTAKVLEVCEDQIRQVKGKD